MIYYSKFTFHDRLVSPANGYSCRTITKQNITSFGFASIQELHEAYPGFPLRCEKTRSTHSNSMRNIATSTKRSDTIAKNNIEKNTNAEIEYSKNPKICVCGSNISFLKRNNKFCCRSCANSRTWSEEDKSKKSEILKNSDNARRSNEIRKQKYFIKNRNDKEEYSKKPSLCVICNKEIEFEKRQNQSCSRECYLVLFSEILRRLDYRRINKFTVKHVAKSGREIILDSTYELAVAIELDKNNIEWERPRPMKYLDKNSKERKYYPDFYLPKYDAYLDPKNDYLIKNDMDKIHRAARQNGAKIIILNKTQLNWRCIEKMIKAVVL